MLKGGTCKYPLTIVIFQKRLFFAAMQRNWSLLQQNLCFFRIVLLVKLVCIVEFSPALAAVQMQQTCFTAKGAQSCYVYVSIEYCQLSDKIGFGCNARELVIVLAKSLLPLYWFCV